MDKFCSLAFGSISSGEFNKSRVCCNNPSPVLDDSGSPILVNETNLDGILNSKIHKEIRKSMLNGESHSSCERCWSVEDNGGLSYRQIWNSEFKSDLKELKENCFEDGTLKKLKIVYLDATLGNKCNLICRMCNPNSSNLWIPESNKFNIWGPVDDETDFIWFSLGDITLENTIKNFSDLKHINFLGGEPLIIDEHLNFLEMLVEAKLSRKISLSYNTNLTTIPKKFMGVWKKFQRISLGISVDGYDKVNDYIRYPIKWEKITKNIKELSLYHDEINLDLSIHSTFQLLNIYYIEEFLEWVYSLGEYGFVRFPFFIWLTFPIWYEVRILDKIERTKLQEKYREISRGYKMKFKQNDREQEWIKIFDSHLEQMITELSGDDLSTGRDRFSHFTQVQDEHRKQDINEMIPELARLL